VANRALDQLGIDEHGLDKMDRSILEILIEKFSGGPVGIKSLGVAIGEDPYTIEDVYEPFLIKLGFMQRTSRGRLAQKSAYELLGKPIKNNQKDLFND
jgi:Holliday junction DNA helicase RuvB